MQNMDSVNNLMPVENGKEVIPVENQLFSSRDIECFIKDYLQAHRISLEQAQPSLNPRWFSHQTYHDYIECIPYLTHWVHDPFVLALVMQVLPQVATMREENCQGQEKQGSITIAHLYDAFVTDWISRQAEKLVLLEISLGAGYQKKALAYAKALAMKMSERSLSSVHYIPRTTQEAESRPDNEWDIFFSDIPIGSDKGNSKTLYWRTLCRQLCPLIQIENYYAFLHPTLLNYFFSRELFEATKIPLQSLNTPWPFPLKTIESGELSPTNTEENSHSSPDTSFLSSSSRRIKYTPSFWVSVQERIAAYEAAHLNHPPQTSSNAQSAADGGESKVVVIRR